jgi:hypothetical protein
LLLLLLLLLRLLRLWPSFPRVSAGALFPEGCDVLLCTAELVLPQIMQEVPSVQPCAVQVIKVDPASTEEHAAQHSTARSTESTAKKDERYHARHIHSTRFRVQKCAQPHCNAAGQIEIKTSTGTAGNSSRRWQESTS